MPSQEESARRSSLASLVSEAKMLDRGRFPARGTGLLLESVSKINFLPRLNVGGGGARVIIALGVLSRNRMSVFGAGGVREQVYIITFGDRQVARRK